MLQLEFELGTYLSKLLAASEDPHYQIDFLVVALSIQEDPLHPQSQYAEWLHCHY